jgi:hypothetical protein
MLDIRFQKSPESPPLLFTAFPAALKVYTPGVAGAVHVNVYSVSPPVIVTGAECVNSLLELTQLVKLEKDPALLLLLFFTAIFTPDFGILACATTTLNVFDSPVASEKGPFPSLKKTVVALFDPPWHPPQPFIELPIFPPLDAKMGLILKRVATHIAKKVNNILAIIAPDILTIDLNKGHSKIRELIE